jgi:hypothetical protein
VKRILRYLSYASLFALASVQAWPQADTSSSQDTEVVKIGEDRMLTPPPVSGQAYPVALESQERTNSLEYGFAFSTAYSDNVLGTTAGHPVSDISYSLWPTIGINEATARLHWDLAYAPGFTFYQHTSARNEADHNANLGFEYRLSPHVTFSARDTFQRSSNVFNQPSYSSGQVFGGAQGPNDSIIAPLADRLSNYGTVGITYQYARDDMIGAGGSFGYLHYPDPTQVPGLFDSSSQSGSAFYTHRLSAQHYLGVAYQLAYFTSYPGGLDAHTQTNSLFGFYTVYPNRHSSLSFFGGPQHSGTVQPAVESLGYKAFTLREWSPGGGISFDWEGHFVGAALSYSHAIREGGGLIGAVQMDDATASVRLQLGPGLTASVSGSYSNNDVLGYSTGLNGHTQVGTVGLERRIGEHLGVQVGYSRLHQVYSIPLIAGAPNTNRESISFSYMFARPLGR